jgi:2-dehydropantoate 2-reductase
MKIVVMGAGAVGCFYGGLLARAGHEVTLIGRHALVEGVAAQGLFMETPSFQAHVPVRATVSAEAVHVAELVLVCVKSSDTATAAAEMAPHLRADATVISLQNGVSNGERLRAVLPHSVLSAVVYVAAEMAGAAHVRHHGRGELVIEAGPGSEGAAAAFRAAGVAVEISADVRGALWAKLVLNCAYNALSALSGLPYGPLAQVPGIQVTLHQLVQECLDVARAEGVQIPGDVGAAVARIAQTMPTQRSSMAQDLERGRRTEADHINGHIAARGAALGVATPVNQALHALVKARERPPAAGAA